MSAAAERQAAGLSAPMTAESIMKNAPARRITSSMPRRKAACAKPTSSTPAREQVTPAERGQAAGTNIRLATVPAAIPGAPARAVSNVHPRLSIPAQAPTRPSHPPVAAESMTSATAKAGMSGVAAHVSRSAPAVTNILVQVPATPVAQALPAVANILNARVPAVISGMALLVLKKPVLLPINIPVLVPAMLAVPVQPVLEKMLLVLVHQTMRGKTEVASKKLQMALLEIYITATAKSLGLKHQEWISILQQVKWVKQTG